MNWGCLLCSEVEMLFSLSMLKSNGVKWLDGAKLPLWSQSFPFISTACVTFTFTANEALTKKQHIRRGVCFVHQWVWMSESRAWRVWQRVSSGQSSHDQMIIGVLIWSSNLPRLTFVLKCVSEDHKLTKCSCHFSHIPCLFCCVFMSTITCFTCVLQQPSLVPWQYDYWTEMKYWFDNEKVLFVSVGKKLNISEEKLDRRDKLSEKSVS